jgi:hypothetical protein
MLCTHAYAYTLTFPTLRHARLTSSTPSTTAPTATRTPLALRLLYPRRCRRVTLPRAPLCAAATLTPARARPLSSHLTSIQRRRVTLPRAPLCAAATLTPARARPLSSHLTSIQLLSVALSRQVHHRRTCCCHWHHKRSCYPRVSGALMLTWLTLTLTPT